MLNYYQLLIVVFLFGGVFLRILLCDDEIKYLTELKMHVEEYMKSHFLKPQYFVTTSANEILKSNDAYDLAFLDIQMDECNGISIAKELKKRNNNVTIFFVTNYPEFQDDAMDLRVFRFFEKPFDVKRLYSGLDKALEYLDETYVDVFLKDRGIFTQILVDDIIYVRRENRKVLISTKKGEYQTNEIFDSLIAKLPTTYFFLVHKSYFVNLHYITKYTYTELYLNQTIRIPIAPRKQVDFHKYWFIYLEGK